MSRYIWAGLVVVGISLAGLNSMAAGQLKFATGVKGSANYYLPLMAAEEKGFWKENSLQVEWIPFRGGGSMFRSVAAGAVKIGFTGTPSVVQAAARGVSALAISELMTKVDFVVWVRADSAIRKPNDLKGAKIGVGRFGGTQHAYGRVVARALGLEKDITFISAGSISAALAGLKTGKIDAIVLSPRRPIKMLLQGVVRILVPVANYLPRQWSNHVVFARKDMVNENPATIQRVVKALLKATSFIKKNPGWSMEKMKQVSGYSDKAAQLIYDGLEYSPDGKIDPKAMANVRKFLIDFGIIKRGKAPDVAALYTDRFTR
ncbi:MAG: ABC transporter substrate-binding protein [Thermodesulfobacteriota bacterium]